jgi:nickel-dependent lactate racemase
VLVLNVQIAYGSGFLGVELPDAATVVSPQHLDAAPDGRRAVLDAIRDPVVGPPLRDLVRPGQRVAIAICDGTRPQPRQIVVPAILDELDGIVRLEDVVVLVATGTHRGNTDEELRAMLGDAVVDSVAVVNHDARDESTLVWMGRYGAGVPVWLNRLWVEADVRVVTGFTEPHFFAGFSGGPKLVAPGLAGLETTLVLHDAARIGHPKARWGVTDGNPVHDDVRAIAIGCGRVAFALDVVLNGEQRIARAFGGELLAMHRAACEVSRAVAMRSVPHRFPVVLTTNAGFPLDQNLYQAVKGMSAAAQVVEPGGTIVCAAECRDGFPDHGSYRAELTSAPSPHALLEAIESRVSTVPDQWQIQIQAGIQSHARVVVHTSYLSHDDLRAAHLEPTDDVEATVTEALAGSDAVCVLPWGPLTVPYVA